MNSDQTSLAAHHATMEKALRSAETFLSNPRIGTVPYMEGPEFYEDAYALLRDVRAVLAGSPVSRSAESVEPNEELAAIVTVVLHADVSYPGGCNLNEPGKLVELVRYLAQQAENWEQNHGNR